VVEELVALAQAYRPPRVILRDPVFARDPQHVAAIAEGLAAAGAPLNWECESRVDQFDDEALLRLMRRAGCSSIKVGLESADPGLLESVRRVEPGQAETYLQRFSWLVDACRRVGLACRPFVMVGLPGQTVEIVQQTADFLTRIRPPYLHVKEFIPYPGSPLWEQKATMPAQELVRQQKAILSEVPLDPPVRPPAWRRALGRLRRTLGKIR
jgi:radical SAM superfamily enzyme YgiQ (UPF0313 family)